MSEDDYSERVLVVFRDGSCIASVSWDNAVALILNGYADPLPTEPDRRIRQLKIVRDLLAGAGDD